LLFQRLFLAERIECHHDDPRARWCMRQKSLANSLASPEEKADNKRLLALVEEPPDVLPRPCETSKVRSACPFRVKLQKSWRKAEVRFSLKNRHGQPGLSGLKSAIFRPCICSKEHRIQSPGAHGSRCCSIRKTDADFG
jgi:hypothetical protein